jgi:hypothetical protein
VKYRRLIVRLEVVRDRDAAACQMQAIADATGVPYEELTA